jgi:hypothetical protein
MTPTPIIRTFPDTGKNTVETAMVLRRAWLGSVGVIVISRKSEYRRRPANARGVYDNKYLFSYVPPNPVTIEGGLAMALDLQQEREQAHALLDLLPPAKLGAVRSLLEVMVDDDELTLRDRAAIQAGLDSLDKNGGIPMEEVLADFGLTMADFEKLPDAPDELTAMKRNG